MTKERKRSLGFVVKIVEERGDNAGGEPKVMQWIAIEAGDYISVSIVRLLHRAQLTKCITQLEVDKKKTCNCTSSRMAGKKEVIHRCGMRNDGIVDRFRHCTGNIEKAFMGFQLRARLQKLARS